MEDDSQTIFSWMLTNTTCYLCLMDVSSLIGAVSSLIGAGRLALVSHLCEEISLLIGWGSGDTKKNRSGKSSNKNGFKTYSTVIFLKILFIPTD